MTSRSNIEVNIKRENVAFEDDSAVITDVNIIRAFVFGGSAALKFLSTIEPLSMEDIDIDSFGRLVIRNPTYVAALREGMSGITGAGENTVCGNAFC